MVSLQCVSNCGIIFSVVSLLYRIVSTNSPFHIYTIGNDAFLEVVNPTASMAQIPLTIFDLVQPQSLHKLYGMLALALDEEVIVKQETSEDDNNATSHMSIILPTKNFRLTCIQYEMTVSITAHFVGT